MKIQVFGSEGFQFVSFAKNKIKQMTEQRKLNKASILKKTLPLGNNIYAQLTSSEAGDSVRITQGIVSIQNVSVGIRYRFMDLGAKFIDSNNQGTTINYRHRLKNFSNTPITIDELKAYALHPNSSSQFPNGSVVAIVGYAGETYFTIEREFNSVIRYTGSDYLNADLPVNILDSFIIENGNITAYSISDSFYVSKIDPNGIYRRNYDFSGFHGEAKGFFIDKYETSSSETPLNEQEVQALLSNSADYIENNTVFYLVQKNSVQQVFYAFKISKQNDNYTILGEAEADYFLSEGGNTFILTGNNQLNDNNGLFELWNYVKKLF